MSEEIAIVNGGNGGRWALTDLDGKLPYSESLFEILVELIEVYISVSDDLADECRGWIWCLRRFLVHTLGRNTCNGFGLVGRHVGVLIWVDSVAENYKQWISRQTSRCPVRHLTPRSISRKLGGNRPSENCLVRRCAA
jgi:hypothetical protein